VLFPTNIQEISDYLTQLKVEKKCIDKQCSSIAIRVTPDIHAHDPISGDGSLKAGGRFNIKPGLREHPDLPDGIRTIYLSDSAETAIREAQLLVKTSSGESLINDSDYTYFFIKYNLSRVIDLTEGDFFDYQLLTGEWGEYYKIRKETSPTQRIAIAAFKLGIQALKVPSAQNLRGYNLAIFSDNLDDKCSINLQEVSKGPKSSGS
jgi:RES domain-containing protein